MRWMPEHVFWIITKYAWNKAISFKHLELDILRVEDIQDSVPPVFLNVVCYETELNCWVPSPYRSTFPYFPTVDIDLYTLWSTSLEYIPGIIKIEFYQREKTYRRVFSRHLRHLKCTGFQLYNFLLGRYFTRINKSDFPDRSDFTPIYESLQLAEPILKSLS